MYSSVVIPGDRCDVADSAFLSAVKNHVKLAALKSRAAVDRARLDVMQ